MPATAICSSASSSACCSLSPRPSSPTAVRNADRLRCRQVVHFESLELLVERSRVVSRVGTTTMRSMFAGTPHVTQGLADRGAEPWVTTRFTSATARSIAGISPSRASHASCDARKCRAPRGPPARHAENECSQGNTARDVADRTERVADAGAKAPWCAMADRLSKARRPAPMRRWPGSRTSAQRCGSAACSPT